MAGNEFQAARDALVAEFSSAKKVASKSSQRTVTRDRRKNRKSDPLTRALKDMGVQIQDIRFGIGDE